MFRAVVTILLVMLIFKSSGQEVKSGSYKFMLDKLLSHSVHEISVVDISKEDEVIYLDAREKKEFDVSRIEGARWVGYEDFDLSRVEDFSKKSKLVVYCSVGYRSEKIAEKLVAAGYEDVSNLYGGIFEWVNQEYAVVDDQSNETSKVHAYSRVWGIWLNKGEKVYD